MGDDPKNEYLLVQMLVHDLNNLVFLAGGHCEMLLDEHGDSAVARDAVRAFTGGLDRLRTKTIALAEVCRLQNGLADQDFRRVELESLAVEIVDAAKLAATEADIGISMSLLGRAVCRADSGILETAFRKLIVHGVANSPVGGCVDVTAGLQGGAFEFVVEDRGEAVPVELRSHLFDRYFRWRGSHNGESASRCGDLDICYAAEAARAHGGSCEAEWPEGGGCRLRLRLPLAPEA